MHAFILALCFTSASAATLDLETGAELAEAQALDATSAAFDLRRMEISQRSTDLNWSPNVSLNASGQGSLGRTFSEQLGTNITEPVASMSASVTASMPLYQGGALSAQRDAAEAQVQAAQQDQQQTVLDLRWLVADWLLQIEQNSDQVLVYQAALEADRALLAQVEIQVEGGKRTKADLYAQQAVVSGRLASLASADQALQEAQLSLLSLLRVQEQEGWDFEAPPQLPQQGEASALIGQALAQRPDLQAAEEQLQVALAQERAAKGGYRPSLSLGAGSSTAWLSSNPDPIADQLEGQNRNWASVDLRVPLLDGGVRRATVDTASVAVQEAQLAQQRWLDQVSLSIRVLLAEQEAAQAYLQASVAAAESASQAVSVLELRYGQGAETLVSLTQARSALVDAELQRAWAKGALQRVRYQLAWTTGALLT